MHSCIQMCAVCEIADLLKVRNALDAELVSVRGALANDPTATIDLQNVDATLADLRAEMNAMKAKMLR